FLSRFLFHDMLSADIHTLSLHDALPISSTNGIDLQISQSDSDSLPGGRILDLVESYSAAVGHEPAMPFGLCCKYAGDVIGQQSQDRKSTRLNSSHRTISYAVFCLKKKKK